MNSKANTNGSARPKKPKKRQGTSTNIEIIVGGRTVRHKEKSVPKRPNPAKPNKTANDEMLDAWKYTYKTRQMRLTKPSIAQPLSARVSR